MKTTCKKCEQQYDWDKSPADKEMCITCHIKECPPTQARFDSAWHAADASAEEDAKNDLDHHEFEFSVDHVLRVADQHYGITLTRDQAEAVVNGANDYTPLDARQCEEALAYFCIWADSSYSSEKDLKLAEETV